MKITIWAGYYVPHVGGYCSNTHELARRLVAEGHSVRVVTCNHADLPKLEYRDGVKIVRLPAWDLLRKQYPVPRPSFALFAEWFRRSDMIVTQTRFFSTSVVGAFYAWWNHIPHVHVERGSVHSVVSGGILGAMSRSYDHTVGAWVVRCAQKNVGVSQACCDFVGHLGGKNRKVIHNGV